MKKQKTEFFQTGRENEKTLSFLGEVVLYTFADYLQTDYFRTKKENKKTEDFFRMKRRMRKLFVG